MTPTFFRASLLALLFAVLPAPSALASESRGITGQEVVTILQGLGYRSGLGQDGVGDPMIMSTIGGLDIYVYFYDCTAGRCGSLQLTVGVDLPNGTTHAVANAFNSSYRYGRVYLDENNDPHLQFDFDVMHTDHTAHVTSQMEVFERLLGDFVRAIGFLGSAEAAPAPTP